MRYHVRMFMSEFNHMSVSNLEICCHFTQSTAASRDAQLTDTTIRHELWMSAHIRWAKHMCAIVRWLYGLAYFKKNCKITIIKKLNIQKATSVSTQPTCKCGTLYLYFKKTYDTIKLSVDISNNTRHQWAHILTTGLYRHSVCFWLLYLQFWCGSWWNVECFKTMRIRHWWLQFSAVIVKIHWQLL